MFTDCGFAACAAEMRCFAATTTPDGRRLVIASPYDVGRRGYLLVADVDAGTVKQVCFPDGVPHKPSYGALLASNGCFYMAQDRDLFEFDPPSCRWTFQCRLSPDLSIPLCMTEGPDGTLWTGGYPKCLVASLDLKTRTLRDHGSMDDREMYLASLAVDRQGWVYSGIGTARANLVAYHPATGEKRQLLPDAERCLGTAMVFPAEDGTVWARLLKRAWRLFDGRAEAMDPVQAPRKRAVCDVRYGTRHSIFADGLEVQSFDLGRRVLRTWDPQTRATREIRFDYQSGGAQITSLGLGPGGMVYASTAHPMHVAVLDVKTRQVRDLGPKVGGNFCAMARHGNLLIGAEYPWGRLYAYDTTRPWSPAAPGQTALGNPWVLAEWKRDIARPRTVLAHPDGRHLVMAGFAGYGLVGGGIGIYDIETRAAALLTADKDLLPGHSCITLKALPNGDLVGGTSVEAPGGGHATAKEAEVFLLDWSTRRVVFRTVPVPGDGDIGSIEVTADGLVLGLSSNSTLFVFDPRARAVTRRESFAAFGSVPRHALHLGSYGTMYALFSKAVVEINPKTLQHRKLADTPQEITAGGALVGDTLCFACGPRVWTFDIPPT